MCNFNKLVNESTAQLEQLIVTRYNKRMLYFYKQRTSQTNSVIVFPICIAVPLTCKHKRKITDGSFSLTYFIKKKKNQCRIHVESVSFWCGYIPPKSNTLTQAALSGETSPVPWVANASLRLPKCFKHDPSITITQAISRLKITKNDHMNTV